MADARGVVMNVRLNWIKVWLGIHRSSVLVCPVAVETSQPDLTTLWMKSHERFPVVYRKRVHQARHQYAAAYNTMGRQAEPVGNLS